MSRRPEPPRGRGPPSGQHRPSRSQEGVDRSRKPQQKELNIFESPPRKRAEPRPRRNSDTSVMEIETEEERRKRKEKERERRHRDQKKPNRKLDVIDKLDATGIYGGGRKFDSLGFPATFTATNRLPSVPPRRPIRCLQPPP